MIDPETAGSGLSALGTAIGEIMEDSVDLALKTSGRAAGARAEALKAAGQDIEILARAMVVLCRRRRTSGPL